MTDLNLTVIDREGATHELVAESGTVLMPVLRDQVDLGVGICGGEISCGTCLVRLDAGWAEHIPAAGEDEAEMLDVLGGGENTRLACQVRLDEAAANGQITLLHEE